MSGWTGGVGIIISFSVFHRPHGFFPFLLDIIPLLLCLSHFFGELNSVQKLQQKATVMTNVSVITF